MRSRIVLDRAVRHVGVDRVLSQDTWWNVALDNASTWFENTTNRWQDKWLSQRLINKDEAPAGYTQEEFKAQELVLELAIKRLQKALSIDAAKDSYTLVVSVRQRWGLRWPVDLCQAVVTEYRKVHVDAHSMEGSLQFFESEYDLCVQRLSDAEGQLRDGKKSHQFDDRHWQARVDPSRDSSATS